MLKLEKAKYNFLEIGEIKPSGWLLNQLKIQRDGLTGNLDLFWPYIKNSAWIGGDSEGWERMPYWLDGAIPTAYFLEDKEMIGRIEKYMEYIFEHQDEKGWLGPKSMNSQLWSSGSDGHYDLWAQFLILKVLVQYYEIKKDEKIFFVIQKTLKCIDAHIDRFPIFNWAKFRWYESLIAIYWYYEKTKEDWILDLAVKIQAQGFNFKSFYENFPYKQPTEMKRWNYMSHVVNNAMAIKAYGLWSRLSGNNEEKDFPNKMIETLDKYHGAVTGNFTGDECLAGTDPRQGTELCAIAEYMFSLETLISNNGMLNLADKLEMLAFNALPATISENMWTHQYDQQVNQIECSVREDWPWKTNRKDANTFGLEPDFGCCTANMHQGWPKYIKSLWAQDEYENLIAVGYAPCEVNKKIKNKKVKIKVETEYPFKEKIKISVENSENANFKIYFRIPNWSTKTLISQNNKNINLAIKNNLIEVNISEPKEIIEINFEAKTEIINRNENYFSIKRGPLVYSLKVDEEWKRINEDLEGRELPHGDFEIYPKSKWNYTIDTTENISVKYNEIGAVPFSSTNPPINLEVTAYEVENWKKENGCVGDIDEKLKLGAKEKKVLNPYGATKLRITEFPKK